MIERKSFLVQGYEPNNGDNNEDCTEMHSNFISQRGGWNDINCEAEVKVVCQKPPSKGPPKHPKPDDPKLKNTCPEGYKKFR